MSAFKFQWVPHKSGMMPVKPKTLVQVRFRDGLEDDGRAAAECWDWMHHNSVCDIVAYRVVEVRP